MGVIKKKTITRGTEGGVKYICDVCSADITNTVSASVALLVFAPAGCASSKSSYPVSSTDEKVHRSVYDARIALATIMTSVFPALQRELPREIMIRGPIHTLS